MQVRRAAGVTTILIVIAVYVIDCNYRTATAPEPSSLYRVQKAAVASPTQSPTISPLMAKAPQTAANSKVARVFVASTMRGLLASHGTVSSLAHVKTVVGVFSTIANVPHHVLTWAYDSSGIGGDGATPSQVQAFTNWDEETSNPPPGKAETDCYPRAGPVACQAVWYFRASILYSQFIPDKYLLQELDSEHLINDAGFYHNTAPVTTDRVSNSGPQLRFCVVTRFGPCYFPNLSNQQVINFLVNCLLRGGSGSACAGLSFTGPAPGTELFADNMPAVCKNKYGFGVYFHGGSTSITPLELGAEPSCDVNLQANILTYLAALKYANGTLARTWLNGYAPLCGTKVCGYPPGDATYWTAGSAPALGVINEGTVCTSSTSPTGGFIGASVLDDMAQLFNEATSGDFVLLNYSAAPAGSAQQLQMRRYCDGIFWLGFNINRSVLWSNYSDGLRNPANASILAVYPEQQIVPTSPIETMGDVTASAYGYNGTGCNGSRQFDSSMRGGAHRLIVSCGVDATGDIAGIYVREFRQCYSWGRLIGSGQCAVVVNMTNAASIIGGSSLKPWRYPSGRIALSQSYNERLIISGNDMVSDGCSTVSGCRTGTGTDLNFGGSFVLYSTPLNPSDAAYLFHS